MQEAVDRGMEAVVLHYLMHGGLKGEVGTSDGEIGVKEILTAMRQPYNGPDTSKKGKPLISLIEHVVLRSESCLSGNQEHEYVKELEGENFEGIPVENVWIAMSSSPYTFSLAGAIPETTPLTSEEMRGDLSGYLSYFNSYHDELMDVIRKRCPNGELPKELSTFNRVNMFIDLATRKSTQGHVQLLFKYDDDSQDMQGRYFRRKEKADGETEKIDNKYSKLDGEMEIFA